MRTTPLLLLTLLSACTDSYDHDPAPKYGEFGVGAFLYRCPAAGDPTCPSGASIAPEFPRSLALGSQIDLEFTWQDDEDHRNDPLPQLQTATSARLRDDGGIFTAVAPGFVAILAVTGNSQVVELAHLKIAEIDRLQVVRTDDSNAAPLLRLDLLTGEDFDLQGAAVDASNVRLGGILPFSWSSADPATLEIVAGGSTGLVRVKARSTGTTELTLTQGPHTLTLPVTIEPGGGSSSSGDGDSSDSSSSGDGSSGDSSGSGGSTTDGTDTTDTTADTDTTSGSTGTTGGAT